MSAGAGTKKPPTYVNGHAVPAIADAQLVDAQARALNVRLEELREKAVHVTKVAGIAFSEARWVDGEKASMEAFAYACEAKRAIREANAAGKVP